MISNPCRMFVVGNTRPIRETSLRVWLFLCVCARSVLVSCVRTRLYFVWISGEVPMVESTDLRKLETFVIERDGLLSGNVEERRRRCVDVNCKL